MVRALRLQHYTAWQLIKAYWQSEQRLKAYAFLISVGFLSILLVAFDVVFTYWSNYFYSAVQAYDKKLALQLLVLFCILAGLYIITAVYRYYVSQVFGWYWRRWLTEQLVGRWLQKKGYYYLENFDPQTDNPDQRIQEDIGSLVNFSILLLTGLIAALTTFPAFIFVLWQLSGEMVLSFGSFGTLRVPGYLVWISIIYALLGTLATFKLGRPLVSLNFEQQRREATFRFAAMDLRSHAEHVALYQGEDHQQHVLQRLFGRVLDNWYVIILRQKLLLWFTAGYNQTSVILPLIVALPNYFNKVFMLGGLMQSMKAFASVQESLSFLVNSYTQIAEWQAISQRLTSFIDHLEKVKADAKREDQVLFSWQSRPVIKIKHLTILTPRQKVLLAQIEMDFEHGKHYLLTGKSGIGKSTFFRTLAGIWPYAAGEIIFPEHQPMLFLPQKLYMPIGTLAEAILFPDHHHPAMAKKLAKTLQDCHLSHLVSRLGETAAWSEQLSPGELQRIAFARALLHQPKWLFLDESTSMLDTENEDCLYQLVKHRLPRCSMVSIGHRASIRAHHDHVIDMIKYMPKRL